MTPIQFLHGVASGDPSTDSAVIWTRVSPDLVSDNELHLTWFVRDLVSEMAKNGRASTGPDCDYTVHVTVPGLMPGHQYEYWFQVGDRASPTGRFRTLPENGATTRFGVASCAKYNAGYFNAYRRLAERSDLHFVLHLGDYIYEAANVPPASQTPGANIGRDLVPTHECRTLSDYRARYAHYRRDRDLQDLHAAHSFVSTLDDHEIADNAWKGGAFEHRPDLHGPWSDRLHAALRAWEEWTPTRSRPVTCGDPIYRCVEVESLFTLVLLETRTNRSDPAGRDRREQTALGADQMEWLREKAVTSMTPWFLLAVPSMLSPLWSPTLDRLASVALKRLKLIEPDNGTPYHDLWDNFPAERDALIALIATIEPAALIFSGDIHVGMESEVWWDGILVANEWTTPSITAQNLDDKMGWTRRTLSLDYEARVRAALSHLRWCNFDDHGYMVVTIDQTGAQCDWWFVPTVLEPSGDEWCSYSTWTSRAKLIPSERTA